ncbi:MAG: hypothetical protein JSW39_08550 [Desulfobacterales bacterium]|nr:MAG: hypothetical protein JSW39_08550 [Desulfobacterales bacterium]
MTGLAEINSYFKLWCILSFNLSRRQLDDLWVYFQARYNVTVLPTADLHAAFPGIAIGEVFDRLSKKTSFGDALMMSVAAKYLSFVKTIMTWDKDYFNDKYPGRVLTPDEFIGAQGVTLRPSRLRIFNRFQRQQAEC